jgi:ribose transport system ATP-binding protein
MRKGFFMSTPVLECRQICKSFGGVTVLNNVDFILEKGEIHALVGQNGAGKSTLMKIINGVYTRDSGDILIEGKEQVYKSAQEARKAGISMVFQDFSLVPTLTVSQNIFSSRIIGWMCCIRRSKNGGDNPKTS